MPDSSAIDAAIVGRLLGDTTLMALMPDGVYFDVAKQAAKRFVLISLLSEADEPVFGGRGYEDALYSIKAVALESSGGDVKTAAARIETLFEDQPLTAAGYTWMTTFRQERVRLVEADAVDPSIRWQQLGAHYRVMMSVNP